MKNCVVVGLSGGFLEPRESTGILLIEATASRLADRARCSQASRAREEFARVQGAARHAVAALPAHRQLLHYVNQAGFRFSQQPVRPAQPVLMR